jgi:hypothetical protein
MKMDAITASRQANIVALERAPTITMTHTAGEATGDDSPILHAAIGIAEQIRAASEEIERGRRIPPSIAAAMKDTGVFGMAMPRAWGGPELDPLTQFRVIEALAMADGSVGWCAMIGCDGGYVTAFLDQDVARTMYPDILVATGAAATTTGQAMRVPGATALAGAFPSLAGAKIANGSGWAASSSKMASHGSIATACRKRGSVFCGCHNAKSWTPGTPRGSAAPGAMTSSCATSLSRKTALSASRIRSWSRGRGHCTHFRSCLWRRVLLRHSVLLVTRSMR